MNNIIRKELENISQAALTSEEASFKLDEQDPLKEYKSHYVIPTKSDITESMFTTNLLVGTDTEKCIYLSSNSLGLQPINAKKLIMEELDVWGQKGVLGHHFHKYGRSWLNVEDQIVPLMAKLIGAHDSEVSIMTTCTANLHIMMSSFYTPTKDRHHILIENRAFPSDHYAMCSQLKLHGYDEDKLIILEDPDHEFLSDKYILDTLDKFGHKIAVVLLPGVQYYTGQVMSMKKITSKAHEKGCIVGFDLAHAVGNVKLDLHDWDIDFAVWSSYKYLSSGPGGIGGLFVNHRYHNRQMGWWSHKEDTRFLMDNNFDMEQGAYAFRLSNPSILNLICLLASLQIYNLPDAFDLFLKKQKMMSVYLHILMEETIDSTKISIISPLDVELRGSQLSLKVMHLDVDSVCNSLISNGIVVDLRRPDCIRVAPFPFVNSFQDIYHFVQTLNKIISSSKTSL